MARKHRWTPGGLVYHVLNRTAGRWKMFRREPDYEAFQRIMLEAHERHPIDILAYCLMPTHWHFVVYPQRDNQVTPFFRWLAHTHAMRWRVAHHTVGYGHLYQGRFKSFPVQTDRHLLTVLRYVERNPLPAKLVRRAELWPHCSLWVGSNGSDQQKSLLSPWPIKRPTNWIEFVNELPSKVELEAIQTSLKRGRPLGTPQWIDRTADRLDLTHTLRREGRPTKVVSGEN